MKIVRSEQFAHWTILPSNIEELEELRAFVAGMPRKTKLNYCGRECDEDGETSVLMFNAGGEDTPVTTPLKGGGSSTKFVYFGGTNLRLTATSDDDRQELFAMRDVCFFGRGGPIVLRSGAAEGEIAGMVLTGGLCRQCQSPMIEMSRCEWGVCKACVEGCDHQWKTGAVHGGDVAIGLGEFCKDCGVAKPKDSTESEKSPLAAALEYQEFDPNILIVGPGLVPVTKLAEAKRAVGDPI